MKVIITKNYNIAPEGHSVVKFEKGQIVDGFNAELAIKHNFGEEVKETEKEPPKPKNKKLPKPKHQG